MIRKFKAVLLSCLFLVCFRSIEADPYIINEFITTTWIEETDSLPVKLWGIQPLYGDSTESFMPEQASNHYLQARIKNPQGKYTLFPVSLSPEAYAKLKIFKIEEFNFQENLRTKFFAQTVSRPEMDLPLVIFDTSYVYIPELPQVFYSFVGIWSKVISQDIELGHVLIETKPSQAVVVLNGKKVGTTPFLFIEKSNTYHHGSLYLDGYFPHDFALVPKTAEFKSFSLQMVPKNNVIKSPSNTNFTRFLLRDSMETNVLDQRLEFTENYLSDYLHYFNHIDSIFESQYPVMSTGPIEETRDQFLKREQIYRIEKQTQHAEVRKLGREHLFQVQSAKDSLWKFLFELESQRVCTELNKQDLQDLVVKQGRDTSWISFTTVKVPHVFRYQGFLETKIPKIQDKESELQLCHYHIYSYDIGKSPIVLAPLTIRFEKGLEIKELKGKFSFPKKITELPQFQRAQYRKNHYDKYYRDLFLRDSLAEVKANQEIIQKRIELRKITRKKMWRLSSASILGVTGILSGTLAYLSSEQADSQYLKYHRALNTADANKYRDKTESLDTRANWYSMISGVTFAASFFVFTF